MFWNKKEEEKKALPDLPQTPSFSVPNDIPTRALPQFPEHPQLQPTSSFHDDLETVQIHPSTQPRTTEFVSPSFQAPALTQQATPEYKPSAIKTKQEEVFVKLDKFQSARKALSSAQHQIEDIAGTLKRIRETKLREEQELASWEKEVTAAKAKIDEINAMLFEKL